MTKTELKIIQKFIKVKQDKGETSYEFGNFRIYYGVDSAILSYKNRDVLYWTDKGIRVSFPFQFEHKLVSLINAIRAYNYSIYMYTFAPEESPLTPPRIIEIRSVITSLTFITWYFTSPNIL